MSENTPTNNLSQSSRASKEQNDHSAPTPQMRTFMNQAGINPVKFGQLNASAEDAKTRIDQRIANYRLEKSNPR